MTNDHHPADVLTDLVRVLGDILRIKPEKIDPGRTFQSMGLDSLLIVEFVAVVNAHYGLRMPATDLSDYPTPAAFAQKIERVTNVGTVMAAAATAALAAAPLSAEPAPPAPALAGQAPMAPGATGIAEVLRERLALILNRTPGDIDIAAPFAVLGVDSIVGAEFTAVVNRTFGLRERAVLLREHPTLADVAAYVAARTGASRQHFPPVPENPRPVLRPAAVPASVAPVASRPPSGDLDVLLDALRDDRLTVDEALVLLARRG